MKTIKTFLVVFLLCTFFMSAQEEKSYLVTVSTFHWNMNMENFSMDEWKAVEKEYLDKVVKKNKFIIGQEILTHYFTADNTEVLLVTMYENWDAIEKAGAKDEELIKAAWSDEKNRKAFFDKRKQYYSKNHSDEIYSTMKGAKMPKGAFDKDVLYYVKTSHFAYPIDGSEKEFDELRKQYSDAVINKNEFIKAYYPNHHAWGADSTQFTEVFIVDSMGDIEKFMDKNAELFKATWKDEGQRKEFEKKMKKYFTGAHSDCIYKLVHELTKS